MSASVIAAARTFVTAWDTGRCWAESLEALRVAIVEADRQSETAPAPDVNVEEPEVAPAAAEADGGPMGGTRTLAAESTNIGRNGHPASLAPVGPDGEWAEGLVGIALRVDDGFVPGRLKPDMTYGCCMQFTPTADVATQHHGVVRVPLVRPVARLEEVWHGDVLVKEESDEGKRVD